MRHCICCHSISMTTPSILRLPRAYLPLHPSSSTSAWSVREEKRGAIFQPTPAEKQHAMRHISGTGTAEHSIRNTQAGDVSIGADYEEAGMSVDGQINVAFICSICMGSEQNRIKNLWGLRLLDSFPSTSVFPPPRKKLPLSVLSS